MTILADVKQKSKCVFKTECNRAFNHSVHLQIQVKKTANRVLKLKDNKHLKKAPTPAIHQKLIDLQLISWD